MEYSVLVEGTNCHFISAGKSRRFGFFVWRCVDAPTATEAEILALQMIRDYLAEIAQNAKVQEYSHALSIRETRPGYGDLTPPGSGFIFIDESPPPLWRRLFGRFIPVYAQTTSIERFLPNR